ncbi:Oidioi.mRNA.OKI2018_I69.chr2.g4712.t1.cds [Oikopleura dioica]|uniref:Oidioi.mRNA.OKI2018_I69.chr2.g4712.t1.cds n=1 Tax=Oikopleura dioica TaxID=34765 RepID=A0ABN7T1J5_OIKDI|nr:Oidioi.mRNA.OKI2018_I69.chr2.g4712.t1.cds [Oikopleura dioica]
MSSTSFSESFLTDTSVDEQNIQFINGKTAVQFRDFIEKSSQFQSIWKALTDERRDKYEIKAKMELLENKIEILSKENASLKNRIETQELKTVEMEESAEDMRIENEILMEKLEST